MKLRGSKTYSRIYQCHSAATQNKGSKNIKKSSLKLYFKWPINIEVAFDDYDRKKNVFTIVQLVKTSEFFS